MIALLQVISSSIVLYIHAFLNFDIFGVSAFFIFASFLMLSLLIFLVMRFKK